MIGTPMPIAMPSEFFAVWMDGTGAVVQGVIRPVPKSDLMPSDIDWSRVIQWAAVGSVR